ncbi:hypothetical protein NCR96_08640 [Helicobacter sp. 14348-15]|uniref:hypothetical protein n=1 Tax=Helicobacter colisuis TaxID=2949739 RepID=UPI00202B557B|nr:hypothetical protein [Helicobacter colisuis]MCL9821798.1 hypothetical protein [Helicobacter colisuis]
MGGGDGLGFIKGFIVILMYGIGIIGLFCSFIFMPILMLLKTQLRKNKHFFYFSKTFYFYIICFLALCVASFIITIMLDMTINIGRERVSGFLSLISHFKIHVFIFAIILCLVPSLAIYFLIRLKSSKRISFDTKDSFMVSKKSSFLLSLKIFIISTIFFITSFFVYLAVIISVLILMDGLDSYIKAM